MNKSKKNDYWKTVECVQTCLKTSLGIGHHFIVQFEANPNKKDPFEPLDFQHKKFKSDEILIKKNLRKYCLKQLARMAYYVQTLYNYEILKMRGEFLIDDFGQVWFVNAADIKVRVKFQYEEIKNRFGQLICRPIKLEEPKVDPLVQMDIEKMRKEREEMAEAEKMRKQGMIKEEDVKELAKKMIDKYHFERD